MIPDKSVQFTDFKSTNSEIQSVNCGQFTWQQQTEKHLARVLLLERVIKVRKVKDAGAPLSVIRAFKLFIH